MKHVVIPFTPQQALALVQDMDTLRAILAHAYRGDFMTLAKEKPKPAEDTLPLQFDDPMDF